MVLLLLLFATASPPCLPALPYFDWNACPFECCEYGRWTAAENVPVHASRSATSAVLFTLPKGARVVAETGVVITRRVGVVRALQPLTLEDDGGKRLHIAAADRFYVLHYSGEGAYAIWYRGRTYDGGAFVKPNSNGGIEASTGEVEVLAQPRWEWWVRVRTADGRAGWVAGSQGFDGADACA